MMGVRWWGWSWAACTSLSNVWRTKLGSHPLYASPGAKVWGHEGFSLFYFRSSSTENITISQRTSTISVLTCMTLNDFDIKKNHDCPITWQHRRWPHPPRKQEMRVCFIALGGLLVWTGPLVVTISDTFLFLIQPTESNLDQATEAHFQPAR